MVAPRHLVAVLVSLAACSGKARPPAPTPAPVAGSDVPAAAPPVPSPEGTSTSLAEVGLEAASLDRTADPCVDFYQFACGGWMQVSQIPADRARWARADELDEKNKAAIKELLEDDAKGVTGDPGAKKLGDFYASCMDDAGIEKSGLAGIRPLLDTAQGVKDASSWLAAVIALHKAGIDVVWKADVGPDPRDSTVDVTSLDSGGLGLPDRDYYAKLDYKDKVDAYRKHVARMLALLGLAQAKADAAAQDVLAIETDLAAATKTALEKRDPEAAYNPSDAKGLAKQVRSVDWKAYWKGLEVAPSAKLIIGTPKFLAAIDGLRARFKPAQWASYFTYHVLDASSFALPKAFDDEALVLATVVTGVEKRPERFKRCIDTTTEALGELLGQQYAAKYFSATAKQTATSYVDAIVKAMGEAIGELDWMSAQTKQVAQAKLGKLVRMIGYPDKWRTYDFDVKRDDFAGNWLRAKSFDIHRVLGRAGKPYDRSEWEMNAFEVNAYYEPSANNSALPAGILQPPLFGANRAVAANLGGIGMVIGHELTHGFDDEGAKFDADGNLKDWWQKADKDKFDAKTTCVADMYSTFEALPKAFVNGRLTLGENVADLGGVKMAYRAYKALRRGAKPQSAEGFTEDQMFFLAVAQVSCERDRPADVQRRLAVNPHAPAKFRVYGALRNLPEFAQAFSCAPGTPMRPERPCAVW